eukprot:scaffold22783_cov17-Tisochrysis_lutea.AAC.2
MQKQAVLQSLHSQAACIHTPDALQLFCFMKANVSKDCTCRVGDRYRTAREEALESGRRGPENRPGVGAMSTFQVARSTLK